MNRTGPLHSLLIIWVSSLLASLPVTAADAGSSLEETRQRADIQLINNDPDAAAETLVQAITEFEAQFGALSGRLLDPLAELADVYLTLGDPQAALDLVRRAQQLVHMHEGVLSPTQLPLLDMAVVAHLKSRKPLEADRERQLQWHIANHAYKKGSDQWQVAALKLADWYQATGQQNLAQRRYEELITYLREHRGENSLEQLPILLLMARGKQVNGSCCALSLTKEAVELASSASAASPLDRAHTLTALGDALMVAHRQDSAISTYRAAWAEIAEEEWATERHALFGEPQPLTMRRHLRHSWSRTVTPGTERRDWRSPHLHPSWPSPNTRNQILHESVPPQEFILLPSGSDYSLIIAEDRGIALNERDVELIGRPFKFNLRQLQMTLPLRMQKLEELTRLYVELMFTVDESGRVQDLRVTDKLAPAGLVILLKHALKKSAFRPRLLNGQAVATTDQKLLQTFTTDLRLPDTWLTPDQMWAETGLQRGR